MKNVIIVLSLALSFVSGQVTASIPKPLVVEGRIVKAAVVNYDLYVMGADSTYTLLESKTVRRTFSISVLTGATYLLCFTTQKGDSTIVKYLLIHPVKKDNFLVDVDFSNDNSAELFWHTGGGQYMIRPYDPGILKLSGNVAKR